MNSYLEIDTTKLESIVTSLENKTNVVSEILQNIDKKMKVCDGTHEIWKGKTQEKVYDIYKEMANKFPKIVSELENYNLFLRKTIENYNSNEKNINHSIENNGENLDVN